MVTIKSVFWNHVEKTDGCWLWTGALDGDGYGVFRISRTRVSRAHLVSYAAEHGDVPDGAQLDHLCHVKHCVNPVHLTPVTHQQNGQNRAGANSNSKSGVRGVTWRKSHQKWMVTVGADGKKHFGGYFADLAEASTAADDLRASLEFHQS